MAATNFTPIQLYYSTTASAAPVSANLANGELAINITDGKLFYKDNGGTVQVLATKDTGTIGGSNTQVQYNSGGALAGSSNFTFNGTTATINTLNLTNALGTTYGGTGLNSYTTGDIVYASASNTLSKLTIGTNGYILTSNGTTPAWTAGSSISVNTATNLSGGAAGSVPYQSAPGATTFLGIGSANTVLTSSGTGPQWVTSLSSLTGVSSSAMTNTSLTSGRVVYSTTGGAQTDSANLTFNGTTLTAGGFSTGGSSTLDKLVKIGDTAFNLPSVLSATAPAKLYVSTATVTDASSAAGATNVLGTIASLGSTTVAASNTGVTYTNLATLYIAGAPTAGTNVTITNPYSLYVAAGDAYFGGTVTAGTVNLTTLDLTNLEVTNIKAKDGTASITLADSTGVASFTANPVLSGGTANGVAYLNGSKVLTTGSALTFDASTLLVNAANVAYRGQISLQGGASDFAQITFYRGATADTNQVGYVHSLNTASSSQAMVIGARNGAFLKFDVGDTERGRFDTSGNFLVGGNHLPYSASNRGYINVNGNSSALVGLSVAGVAGGYLYSSGTNLYLGAPTSYNILFDINGEKSRFTPDGDFLVGRTANTYLGATTFKGLFVNSGANTSLGIAGGTYTGAYLGQLYLSGGYGDGGSRVSGYFIRSQASGSGGNVNNELQFVAQTDNGAAETTRAIFSTDGVFVVGAGSVASGFVSIAQIQASGTNGGIIINSSLTGASDYSRLIFTKGNASGNEGLIRYSTNDYHMAFWTNATEKARITSAGNTYINRTSGQNNGKFEVLADSGAQAIVAQVQSNGNSLFQGFGSAGGSAVFQVTGNGALGTNTVDLYQGALTFPATQVPSSNANTLDDYEEGTFTPTLRGSGTAGNFNEAVRVGSYTKVGNMVTLYCAITCGAITGSPTGNLQITGLPFSVAAGTSGNGAAQVGGVGQSTVQGVSFSTRASTNVLYVTYIDGSNNAQIIQASSVSGSAIIDFCISYPAA